MTSLVGSGIGLNSRGTISNVWTLQAGQTRLIPAGNQLVTPGMYTFLQFLDPITGIWRNMTQLPNITIPVPSDGVNYRLANLTGCMVGAVVGSGGTGYTTTGTTVTVTASSGSPTIVPVIGGAIATTGTFSTVGTGYTYNPSIQFAAPPSPGVTAQGYITVSGSTGSAIVITNQGAGYGTTFPSYTIVNDIRDTTGYGITITGTIASTCAGAITALLVTNHGIPVSTIPTLSSATSGAGTGASFTPIMCMVVTSATTTSGGTGFSTTANIVIGVGGFVTASTTQFLNPAVGQQPAIATAGTAGWDGIFVPRNCLITMTAGTTLGTATAIIDGGMFQAAPILGPISANGGGTLGTITCAYGGVSDVSYVVPQ